MNTACRSFRSLLERYLEQSGTGPELELKELSWHEHLLGCCECRRLLEAEEALELLLADLPQPHLPPALARRLLLRLRASREQDSLDLLLELDTEQGLSSSEREQRAGLARNILDGLASQRAACASDAQARLDALLELDRELRPPAGLAQRTLGALAQPRSERERQLDELLDRAEVSIPDGLSARILKKLRSRPAPLVALPAGVSTVPNARGVAPRTRWGYWIGALAAGLLLAATLWWALEAGSRAAHEAQPIADGPPVTSSPEPEEELLAVLDQLEAWELIEELDEELELIGSFSVADEVWLPYAAEAGAEDELERTPDSESDALEDEG